MSSLAPRDTKDKLQLIHAIDTTDCLCSGARLGPHHMGPYAQTYPVMGQKALYNLRDINRARTVYCLTSVIRRSLIPSPRHRVLKDPRRSRLANHVEWRVYSADRCKHQHIRLDAIRWVNAVLCRGHVRPASGQNTCSITSSQHDVCLLLCEWKTGCVYVAVLAST